ncbi:MAG: dgt [Rickettsiales bacterium]|jgi:dGTPase|nr:dgt [Rickettsiales bacterium]
MPSTRTAKKPQTTTTQRTSFSKEPAPVLEQGLVSYASRACDTRGRVHKEKEDTHRSAFRRDCDRIIHSTAFRRLEYKTQVFVNHEGDHYRTRLTHSLEVAQIARSIARLLRLDEDLTEGLALAHDLGHPPFGHAGEEALDTAMELYGGFDHNAQTLVVITQLEQHYAHFDGLNLTWETLEGVLKHNGPLTGKNRDIKRYSGKLPKAIAVYNKKFDLALDRFPSAEAQVAAIADDIAYNNHDLDDGLRAGLFTLEDLYPLPFVGEIFREVKQAYPNLERDRIIHEAIRRMISRMIHDVIQETTRRAKATKISHADDVRALPHALVSFSAKLHKQNLEIKSFLMEHMYRHYRICRMTTKASSVVQEIFTRLFEKPECLPTEWRNKAIAAKTAEARAETIAHFIAGMTDRFAIEEHKRLFNMDYKG